MSVSIEWFVTLPAVLAGVFVGDFLFGRDGLVDLGLLRKDNVFCVPFLTSAAVFFFASVSLDGLPPLPTAGPRDPL